MKAHNKKLGRVNKKRGGIKSMQKRFSRKSKMTIPLSIVAGFAVPAAKLASDYTKYKDINVTTRQLGQFFTGYDWTSGAWSSQSLKFGLMPVLAGFMVHKLAGRFGINRALGAAGIPLIRI